MASSPNLSPQQVENFLLQPTTRLWVYSVTIVVIALLQGYGILLNTQAQLWTGVASAVLGIANLGVLAIPNVPKPPAPTINDPGMGK